MPDSSSNPSTPSRGYAYYALGVLFLVYIFNFIDRQILSILAEDIKADLGISDARIGFLFGTVFAVFYAVFGIPLGKLADTWNRRSLIAIGLAGWSLMTALSGTARSFTSLALYRVGVGIGEASATPAALSMLADTFPKRMRGAVMALYSSGIYVGAGVGIVIGGEVVTGWNQAYPGGEGAPFGLKGWHAAYLLVGLPGLLMALWVRSLREPVRGAMDGITTPPHPHPFRASWQEFLSLLPGVALRSLRQAGGTSRDAMVQVLVGLGALAAIALMTLLLGDLVQWSALFIGIYTVFCWAHVTMRRDPVVFHLLFNTPSLVLAVLGFSCMAFVTYSVGFWIAPFFIRVHGMSAAEVGQVVGWGSAIGGCAGVILGGVLSDALRNFATAGRLYMGAVAALLAVLAGFGSLTLGNTTAALVVYMAFVLLSPMWIGAATATVADLVLPRMRAVASAMYIMTITFVGLALGPYTVGRLSDALGAVQGPQEGLRNANLLALLMLVVSATLLLLASRHIARDEASIRERAQKLGEKLDAEPAAPEAAPAKA